MYQEHYEVKINHIFSLIYLYLLWACIHPVEKSADRIKGQGLDILQTFPDYQLLARTAVQTQPLQTRREMERLLGLLNPFNNCMKVSCMWMQMHMNISQLVILPKEKQIFPFKTWKVKKE